MKLEKRVRKGEKRRKREKKTKGDKQKGTQKMGG